MEFSKDKFCIAGDYEELIMMLQFCLVGINKNPFRSEEFSRLHDKVVKILASMGRLDEVGVVGF